MLKSFNQFNENHSDLEELYAIKRNLENRIENYFGDERGHTGDMGYQDLLNDLSDIEDQIDALENTRKC